MADITIKEVLITIVVVWFQISLSSINTRLSGIEINIGNQRVDTAKLQKAVEGQGETTLFLRAELGKVDDKLSEHIENTPSIKQ